MNDNDYELDDDETDNDMDRIKIDVDKVNYFNVNKRESIISNESGQPGTGKEPKFIVTLNGINEAKFYANINKKRSFDEMENEDDLELDYNDDISSEQEMVENGDSMEAGGDAQSKKKLVRCTFWPLCQKGDECPYLHPNKPCTTFPNCTYGQLCHYIHPTCRYDGYCNRVTCPFLHYVKKPDPSLVNPATVGASSTTTMVNQSENAASTITDESAKQPTIHPKITINKIQPFSLVNKPATTIESPATTTSTTNSTPVNNTTISSSNPLPPGKICFFVF